MKKLLRFLKDEEGATEIEYGLIAALIAALIAVVIVVTVATIVVKRLEKRPGGGARLQRGG
jgi:Flp pilus assembly pilin Flp